MRDAEDSALGTLIRGYECTEWTVLEQYALQNRAEFIKGFAKPSSAKELIT